MAEPTTDTTDTAAPADERVSTSTDTLAADTSTDERVSTEIDTPAEQATEGVPVDGHPPAGVGTADTSSSSNEELDDVEDQDAEPDDSRAGRQAAKYRAQLRDTEVQRDTATAALAAQQLAIVHNHAGAKNGSRAPIAPELLAANGFQLADHLDENGLVDLDKVEQFTAATADKFGIRLTGFAPNRGQGGTGSMPPGFGGAPKGGIADAFRQR